VRAGLQAWLPRACRGAHCDSGLILSLLIYEMTTWADMQGGGHMAEKQLERADVIPKGDDAFRDDRLLAQMQNIVTGETTFGIRLVDTPEGRNKASMLIHKMYSWRGLEGTHGLTDDPNRITLMAHRQDEPVGTLTLGMDNPCGILADQLFGHEVQAHRARGLKVCEFIKLAFDMGPQSKGYLAALIHLAVIYAYDIHRHDSLFIEVTPRHRQFYQRMLGFRQLGDEVVNPRVNVRGVLMHIDLQYMKEQIHRHGGNPDSDERSFYPLFYSQREEAGIINRLRNLE
jgi:hypothetical protein